MEKIWKDVCVLCYVVIIMDGNNCWVKKCFLFGVVGYKVGVDVVRVVIEVCVEVGVEVFILFVFFSENWQCLVDEVSVLMELFFVVLCCEVCKFDENGICLCIIGDCMCFYLELQVVMCEVEVVIVGNICFFFQVVVNYGGQWDIVQVVQCLVCEVQGGYLVVDDIFVELFQGCLVIGDQLLFDLCICIGGEYCISNFFFWQLVYVELYFFDLFWFDFKYVVMWVVLVDFFKCQCCFGKISE